MESDPRNIPKLYQGLPKHFVWVTDKHPWAKRVKRQAKRSGRSKSLRQELRDAQE